MKIKQAASVLFTLGMLGMTGTCTPCKNQITQDALRSNTNLPPGLSGVGTGEVLQYHNNLNRDGLFIDPVLTVDHVKQLKLSTTFAPQITGPVYAQPLSVNNLLILATEQNEVLALDQEEGHVVWSRKLGTPVKRNSLPCGNIDPLGITGTPVIDSDASAHTLFVDAMTTPDDGVTKKHLIFALSTIDGSVRAGWPVDIEVALAQQGLKFHSEVQNQRGALTILGDTVYVPFGGHFGDCGDFKGWVVGVKISDPTKVTSWSIAGAGAGGGGGGGGGGGVWAPAGISSDGASLFIGTGNTENATDWIGGEGVLKLLPGPIFNPISQNYFAPTDWKQLDDTDNDIGSTTPLPIQVSGTSNNGSFDYIVEFGKNGKMYLLDKSNLGGISGGLLTQEVATGRIISAPTVYKISTNTYVAFKAAGKGCPSGSAGDLMSVCVSHSDSGQVSITTAWCAKQNGMGSPITTAVNANSPSLVWSIGAEGDAILRAFDALTGETVFTSQPLGSVRRYQTPIVVKGRVFVAGDDRIYKFGISP